jgi:hypothetical protein
MTIRVLVVMKGMRAFVLLMAVEGMDVTRSGGRLGGYYRFSKVQVCFDTVASKSDTNCGHRPVATIVEVVASTIAATKGRRGLALYLETRGRWLSPRGSERLSNHFHIRLSLGSGTSGLGLSHGSPDPVSYSRVLSLALTYN